MQNGNSRVRLQAKWDALRQAGEIIAGINILLRLTGRLKIRNQQNFPKEPEPLLIVANHLSKFVEAILLLPGLFAPWYWRNMCHSAWNTPDRDNFKALRHHSLSWALLRTEFMPRNGNWRQQLAAIDRVAARLRAGESAIFFPEGGRTSSGNGERLYSPMLGKPMRPLVKGGLTRLVLRSQARVLPVWAEGTDKVFPRNALLPRP
ncbi:MAG: lysophospholipid acyltransferase family protein, partial [bacterium]|nr:lysophospholipid acyltransferase family protein [bacterium]